VTVADAAWCYKVSGRTVRRWIGEGRMTAVWRDGRWLVWLGEVEQLARLDRRDLGVAK
jgi:membrane protein required for beta-lactamase induction